MDAFGEGDTVGCLFLYAQGTAEPEIAFTRNGERLPPAFKGAVVGGFYPAVTITHGARVRVNFGQEPFIHQPPERPVPRAEPEQPQLEIERKVPGAYGPNGASYGTEGEGEDVAETVKLERKSPAPVDAEGRAGVAGGPAGGSAFPSPSLSRRAVAMDLMAQGVLPECTLEQVELALELNDDDVEQTVAWAFEHPIDFHQLGAAAQEDEDGHVPSAPPLSDGAGYESLGSYSLRRVALRSSNELAVDDERERAYYTRQQPVQARILDPNVAEVLLSSLGAADNRRAQMLASLLMLAEVLPGAHAHEAADQRGGQRLLLVTHAPPKGEKERPQPVYRRDELRVGLRVRISPSARKSALSRLGKGEEVVPVWLPEMDATLGRPGIVREVDRERGIAMVDVADPESGVMHSWWYPFEFLLRCVSFCQNGYLGLGSATAAWADRKSVV